MIGAVGYLVNVYAVNVHAVNMYALSTLETIGIFVGIPIGVFMLIALLVAVPTWAREGRYRPGLSWDAEPVWFNGPQQGLQEIESAEPTVNAGGAGGVW